MKKSCCEFKSLRALSDNIQLISLILLSTGCSRIHVNPNVEMPKSYLEQEGKRDQGPRSTVISIDDPWWRSLGDPALDHLIEGLFSQNLQLAQARERVIQMRAVARQAGSQRWPTLNLDMGWSRTKQLNPFSRLSSGSGTPMPPGSMDGQAGGNSASPFPSSFTQDNFRASLAVSYELDVWGRIGSLTEAAEREAIASESDMYSMAITLSATIADVYFQVIETQARLTILESQLRDDEDQLEVVISRFNQGLSPHIEVLQQTQQRDRTHAQLPPVKALLSRLKRRIAALWGRSQLEDTFVFATQLPEALALPQVGLPASLLESRPDIRSAAARLSAADARVSAAVSARLPGLRFGTSVGYQSFQFDELFDDFIWSLTGNLITPLFQGGRLRAEQSRTEAALRESLLAMRERLLTAYHEVEDALSNERSLGEQLNRVEKQLSSAETLFESAHSRYLQGVGDFITTLTARQGLYASQLAALAAKRASLSARVQLHRALGGGWVHQLSDRPLPTGEATESRATESRAPESREPQNSNR